jgi:hypothetical protein
MNSISHHPSSLSIFTGTRDDFIRAMKLLGGLVESNYLVHFEHNPLHVRMRCSADDWVRVFGPVRILAVQFGPGGHPAFEAWEYQCTDGSILCVGCKYEHICGDYWVTVRAVYLL